MTKQGESIAEIVGLSRIFVHTRSS
jgi:hypothetical protein